MDEDVNDICHRVDQHCTIMMRFLANKQVFEDFSAIASLDEMRQLSELLTAIHNKAKDLHANCPYCRLH